MYMRDQHLLYNTRKVPFFVVVIIILITIEFWSFNIIPNTLFRALELICILFLVSVSIRYYSVIRSLNMPFWIYIKVLLITTLLFSSFGALWFHKQEFYFSIWWQRTHLLWLIYPILHLFNLSPQKLIKAMLVIGIVWCITNVVQQFTYPTYFFSSKIESADSDFYRAGIYRFMPRQLHYALFLGFYAFQRMLDTKKTIYAIMFLATLIGLYFYGTRQFLAGFVGSVIAFTYFQKGSAKAFGAAIIALVGVIVLVYQDLILGNLIEITNDQVSNKDYIRLLEIKFYLFENWENWFNVIVGNGLAYESSAYGKEAEYIKETLMYYSSDVGIIGSLNNFGVIYCIAAVVILVKVIRTSYTQANRYLIMIGLNAVLLLLFTEYFMEAGAIPFWCIFLYLIDKDQSELKSVKNRALYSI
jgi:hypothetical protein